MRFVTPVVMLIAAVLLTGCDHVPAPPPDASRDAAFVTHLQQLCMGTPALATINPEAGRAAVIATTDANYKVVTNLYRGLVKLTPSLASSSTLAPRVTDLALMLDDMQIRYLKIKLAARKNETTSLGSMAKLALKRAAQARTDLGKIGVTSCLN